MVEVEFNVTANEQLNEFMNSTFQGHGDIAFSIATKLEVPEVVVKQGQIAVGDYIKDYLTRVSYEYPELEFEVKVGTDY